MEERKYFSVAFKKAVVKEVLSGKINKEQAKHKYGIAGNTAILNWIRKFEAEKKEQMSGKKTINLSPTEQHELELENKRLREELEIERLRTLSLNVMIDIAEDQFKIPIRKKSGTKQ